MTTASATLSDNLSVHPVPRGARVDDVTPLLKRATWVSISLHLALVGIALLVNYWPRSEKIGIAQDEILSAMIVPLSALDTQLPKGSTAAPPVSPPESDAVSAVQPKPIIKKDEPASKVTSPKASAPRRPITNDNSRINTTSATQPSTSGAQPLGVPNGMDISAEQARISYQDMVATLLARAKRYPERALKRRMTGEGTIRIHIAADGSVQTFEIVRSTDTSILDDELKAMVERASPFPAFPRDLHRSSMAIVVPVAFVVNN